MVCGTICKAPAVYTVSWPPLKTSWCLQPFVRHARKTYSWIAAFSAFNHFQFQSWATKNTKNVFWRKLFVFCAWLMFRAKWSTCSGDVYCHPTRLETNMQYEWISSRHYDRVSSCVYSPNFNVFFVRFCGDFAQSRGLPPRETPMRKGVFLSFCSFACFGILCLDRFSRQG